MSKKLKIIIVAVLVTVTLPISIPIVLALLTALWEIIVSFYPFLNLGL